MQVEPAGHASAPSSLSALAQLRSALLALEELCGRGTSPRVRHLLLQDGTSSPSALPAMLLALPFLTPVSLGPITAPASAVICLCGIRVLRSSTAARVPGWVMNLPIPIAAIRAMRATLDRLHGWVVRVSRPRLHPLVLGRAGRTICGFGLVVGALLLAVPIPFLPLTNTFPALGIILLGLGWSERDGLLTLLGAAALLASIALFTAIGSGLLLAVGGLPFG